MLSREHRTRSDPCFNGHLVRPPRRWNSATDALIEALPHHRHEDIAVRSEFLEQICKLHDEFRVEAASSSDLYGGLTDAVLDGAFGAEGTWLVHGALPEDGTFFSAVEEPFSARRLVCCPPALEGSTVAGLLQRWGAAAITSKGCKMANDHGLGQDNCCMARLAGGWGLIGVFDGHGPRGHWPSTRVARTLPFFLQSGKGVALLREGNVEAALHFAFKAVEHDLEAESVLQNIDLQINGCTGLAALYHASSDSVWLASVGDSRAVLLAPSRGAAQETSDHKPCREDEAARILRLGGDVKTTTYGDGYVDERVYLKNQSFPGLGVTRSFGDCLVKDIGVSAEPEVVRWPLKGVEDAYVLACSDGVWELLSSDEVCTCVLGSLAGGKTPQQALEELLAISQQAWKSAEEPGYCDDITIVLMPLFRRQVPSWEAVAGIEEAAAVAKAFLKAGDDCCRLQ